MAGHMVRMNDERLPKGYEKKKQGGGRIRRDNCYDGITV